MMILKGVIWIGINVSDMPTELNFYHEVLELPLIRKGDGWAHLDAGQGLLLELMMTDTASIDPAVGLAQKLVVGFLVDDLDRTIELLKERGVIFTGEVGKFRNQRWVHFSDPEGNRLEIKEIRPASSARS